MCCNKHFFCQKSQRTLADNENQLTFISRSLHGAANQSWIPNSLSLVQAVLGPVISFASDTFQARKALLVGCCLVAFVGCAIAPGSQTIGRLIAAQTLIGVGFAAVPLAYAVPSEIMPRRQRPGELWFHSGASLPVVTDQTCFSCTSSHELFRLLWRYHWTSQYWRNDQR